MRLTQDNHQKLSVQIEEEALIHHLRRFFGWRKDVTYRRLMGQGSVAFDSFIEYLHKEGYGIIEPKGAADEPEQTRTDGTVD